MHSQYTKSKVNEHDLQNQPLAKYYVPPPTTFPSCWKSPQLHLPRVEISSTLLTPQNIRRRHSTHTLSDSDKSFQIQYYKKQKLPPQFNYLHSIPRSLFPKTQPNKSLLNPTPSTTLSTENPIAKQNPQTPTTIAPTKLAPLQGTMSMFLLLLLLILLTTTITTTTSTSTPTPTSPSRHPSHPHFQQLNVKQTIAETKLNPTQIPKQPQNQAKHQKPNNTTSGRSSKWKLNLFHRDKVTTFNTTHDHRARFNARMQRDARRVATLVRRISTGSHGGAAKYEAEEFGSDVVSGMDQGSGEYFVRIGVGSPPKNQYVVIDSGSDIVWVQCQPCTQCYRQSDPVFDPADSSSYAGVSCGSAVCSRLENAGCHEGRCRYEVSYGDGSYTKGTLALETLTFGRTVIRNVAIGCGHRNQGMFVGAAGLLGLGGGPMSFVGQLGGQTGGAFSYCLVSRGTGSSGSVQFGREAMPVGAAWVPLIHNPKAPSFYYVGLSGLEVGGLKVPVSEDVFKISEFGDGGVVMDTGTAVTRLPTAAYNAFRNAFIAQTTNLPRASGVSIFDTCYDLYGFVSVRVPTVSFYFSGGPILTLPARNILIPVDDAGTFCFAFAPSPSGLSIIGNIQQEGIEISVDGANGFVGFGPNVC